MIKTLDEFSKPDAIEEYPQPSDSQEGLIYRPTINPPSCQCKDFIYRGGHCKHIQRAVIDRLKRENRYLRERGVVESTAFWHSFDALMEHYEWSDNWEVNTLCNSFLLILLNAGPSTTDSLHNFIGDQFQHDKRIVGAAIKRLITYELIQAVGYQKSDRKICHGSIKRIYELTQNGQMSMGRYKV